MEKLFLLATSSSYKELFRVKNGTHNDTYEKAGMLYYDVIIIYSFSSYYYFWLKIYLIVNIENKNFR